MIKFGYKKEGESRTFTFGSVFEKIFRSIKKRIDNSKVGGLIYIAIFALLLFLGYVAVRKLYYSESVRPAEYEVIELHQKRSMSRKGESGWEYLKIEVELKNEGQPVTATLIYEGGNRDVIYKDWCAFYAYYDSDKEETYSYLEHYDNVKEALGTLHYNKKHPEKVVDSILGF